MHCAAHKHSGQVHRQSNGMLITCMALGLILALGGCGSGGVRDIFKDPSGAPIKDTVRTAVPLAYAASVAMASVAGTRPPNAWVSNRCPIYPCASMVTITDDDSTMPLRLASLGTVRVYGFWNSPDKAILSVSFSGAAASDPISTVSLVPVSRSTDSLKIVYGGVNMTTTVTDPQTLSAAELDLIYLRMQSTVSTEVSDNMSMDAWEVVRNDRGTTDVSDDTYSIGGGGEYIESGPGSFSVLVLAMAGVMMGPDCALNPTSGSYMINELGNTSPVGVVANAFIGFHSACDGKADVALASGNYMLSTGKSIPLNFGNP